MPLFNLRRKPRATALVAAQSTAAQSTLVKSGGWRLAVAGGLSGMLTSTVLHPLDTIKTVRQADPTAFKGITPTLVALCRQRGPAALYAGLAPAVIGSTVSTALYFGMYEFAKATFARMLPAAWESPRSRVPLTALSAACGNVASSIVYVPKEVIKQRMQSAQSTLGARAVIADVLRSSGLSGLYVGYSATLLRNIPSAMMRFAAFEEFKLLVRGLRDRRANCADGGRGMSPLELVAAGSMAGALSSALTTPMDVVKTRLATGAIQRGTSLPAAFRNIVREQGVAGLFVGLRPRVLWSALFSAIGFTTYEITKSWLTGQPTEVLSIPRNHSEIKQKQQ